MSIGAHLHVPLNPQRNAKLISSSPTVKIIDECMLNPQETREEERRQWEERLGGRRGGGQVLISTL